MLIINSSWHMHMRFRPLQLDHVLMMCADKFTKEIFCQMYMQGFRSYFLHVAIAAKFATPRHCMPAWSHSTCRRQMSLSTSCKERLSFTHH